MRGWKQTSSRRTGDPARLACDMPARILAGCRIMSAHLSFHRGRRLGRGSSPLAGLSTPGMRTSPVADCVRKASPPGSPSISTPRPAGPSSWRWVASASWCHAQKPLPPVPSWPIRNAAFSKPACLRKTWQLRPCAALPAVPATSPPDALVRCCRCWACWLSSAPSFRCGSIAVVAGGAGTPGCIERHVDTPRRPAAGRPVTVATMEDRSRITEHALGHTSPASAICRHHPEMAGRGRRIDAP